MNRDEHYEFSKGTAMNMESKEYMPGTPIFFEHDTQRVKVGEVVSTQMDPDGSWHSKFFIDDETLPGLDAMKMVKEKLITGLSLSHYREAEYPDELSLCWQGARPGTGITYEEISAPNEMEIAKADSYIDTAVTQEHIPE